MIFTKVNVGKNNRLYNIRYYVYPIHTQMDERWSEGGRGKEELTIIQSKDKCAVVHEGVVECVRGKSANDII